MAQRARQQPAEGEDGIARLTHMLAGMLGNRGGDAQFKAPKFDGTQDVELFIRQFTDVQNANGWNAHAALLHLRRALESKATDCGDGQDVNHVFTNLRARFGLTARQARDRLGHLRKESRQSYHEFGALIERLVNIAYVDLPAASRTEIALDNFGRSLDNRALQRHLLAVPPVTIAAAVRTAEEFMQVGTGTVPTNRHRMTAIYGDEEAEEPAQQLALVERQRPREDDRLEALTALVQRNSESIAKLLDKLNDKEKTNSDRGPARRARKLECFECGGEHFRRDCPQFIQKNRTGTAQGNAQGPQETEQ